MAQNMVYILQQHRFHNHCLKNRAFVDQIGETTAACLLFELRTGLFAFFSKQNFDSPSERRDEGRMRTPRREVLRG